MSHAPHGVTILGAGFGKRVILPVCLMADDPATAAAFGANCRL